MHIDRRLVGFGLFLITIGGIMVAVRQGAIDSRVAADAWHLWPLIIVGLGLSIALAGRPGAPVGGLIVALTFGAIVGGFAATGSVPGAGLCGGSRDGGAPFADRGGTLLPGAQITIVHNCGDLAVGTVAGSTWSLTGRADNGAQPTTVERAGSGLRISAPERGIMDLDRGSSWTVVLPQDPNIELSVELNGGDGRLALAGATIDSLSVEGNAGSVDLDLRDVAALGSADVKLNFGSATIHLPARSASITLDVNAGSAGLCLPTGAGLRVKLESVAASSDFQQHGMALEGGAWQTPGFATAEIRLDVTADVNAGSLSLDPVRSCAG